MAEESGNKNAHENGNSGARADGAAATAPEKLESRDELRKRQERLLDEAVEETFPASDPVSVAVVKLSGPKLDRTGE